MLRNHGYFKDVPQLTKRTEEPTPWSPDVIMEFSRVVNGRVLVPCGYKGKLHRSNAVLQFKNVTVTCMLNCWTGYFKSLPDDMTVFSDPILKPIQDKQKVYVQPSKLKDAGLGLFCAQGWKKHLTIVFVAEFCKRPSTKDHLATVIFPPFSDLPEGYEIPFFGCAAVCKVDLSAPDEPTEIFEEKKGSSAWTNYTSQ